jgi:hypothetical protein
MQRSLDAINAALRVLNSFNAKRLPKKEDVAALELLAGPCPPDIDLDEFACTVIIQKAIEYREKTLERRPPARKIEDES